MSFIDCILGNKLLSPAQKEKLVKEYEKLAEYNIKKFGPIDGPQIAAQRYVQNKAQELTEKAENSVRSALIWKQTSKDLLAEADAIKQIKERSGWGKALYYKSNMVSAVAGHLDRLAIKIGGDYQSALITIADVVEKYRVHNAGLTQDTAGFKLIVAEMQGKNTGNAEAKSIAGGIRKLFDDLHEQYRHVGGIMGKLNNYFPQTHDAKKILAMGREPWKAFIKGLIKVDKIIDEKTGIPLSPKELDEALNASFDSITTHGLVDVKAQDGVATHQSALASRRSASREFIFKDADAYFAYNSQLGYGDEGLFNAMVGYIAGMTRDIAIMREFGPNADHHMKNMIEMAKADGARAQPLRTLQGMYDTVSGKNSHVGDLGFGTTALINTQDFLRAVLLGGAPISAVGDSFWGGMAAKMNGLSAMGVTKRYLSYLNPANAVDRQIMRRSIYVSGEVNGRTFGQNKFADAQGHGLMSKLASTVNSATGLGMMTDAARTAIVREAQGFMAMAKDSAMKFKDIPQEMQDALRRWGMDEADFSNIVKAEATVADASGADFITPQDVALIDKETARKYSYWLFDMSQKASNEPGLLTRAITTGAVAGQAQRGTAVRNVASSITMFKSFGITVTLNHILPALRQGASEGKWGRAGAIMVGSTLIGASTLQLKAMLYGKTPQDMDTVKFWKSAALQGGGFGIFDTFVLADSNAYNESIAKGLAGPVVGLADDTRKLFMGNFDKAIEEGKESKFIADLAKYTQRYTPKMWYTRLLQERIMYDQLNRMADPLYDTKMRRLENKMRRDKGQEFWWGPND